MSIEVFADMLLWTGVTFVVYGLSAKLTRLSRFTGFLHPIIFSVGILFFVFQQTSTSVEHYVQATLPLTWFLLPATIVLAVPLYNQFALLKQLGFKLLVPIMVGGVIAPLVAVGIMWIMGLDFSIWASALTKSITTPLAIETTQVLGGVPSLAAIMVIVTGIFGVMISGPVFSFLKINDEVSKGLALGTAAHALGTAHAVNYGNKAVGFATLSLCINGIATSIVLSFIFWLA